MSKKKIVMKINRYIKKIGEDDLILDNGSVIQVTTQTGAFSGYHYGAMIMSKKLFNELKKFDLIFLDVAKTKQANPNINPPRLFYFRFNIEKLERMGYEVIEE